MVLDSRCGKIPKEQFPPLLKKLIHVMDERRLDVLPNGFRKCSIYSLNRAEVLNRLPDEDMTNQGLEVKQALSECFLEQLQRQLPLQHINSKKVNMLTLLVVKA